MLVPLCTFDLKFDGPICGIDEVGRGCLAGPVVACSAVVDYSKFKTLSVEDQLLFQDSKKLTTNKRKLAIQKMKHFLVDIAIGSASVEEIDSINILNASLLAMGRSFKRLRKITPKLALVDGNQPIKKFPIPQQTITSGDAKSLCIAVASIYAKEFRDRLMVEWGSELPSYGFERHMGYGTALHKSKIEEFGPCEIHRKSFAPIKKYFLSPNNSQTC